MYAQWANLRVTVVELGGAGLPVDYRVDGLQVAGVGHQRQVNPETTTNQKEANKGEGPEGP